MNKSTKHAVGSLLFLLFGLFLLSDCAVAQSSNGVQTISVVGPSQFTVAPGTTIAQRFTVKVIDANGNPTPGVQVSFNLAIDFDCAVNIVCPASWFGHFLGNADVLTDANGIAAAPLFVAAGISRTNHVYAYVPDGGPADDYISVQFAIITQSPQTVSAPLLSIECMALLGVLVVIVATTVLTKRRLL